MWLYCLPEDQAGDPFPDSPHSSSKGPQEPPYWEQEPCAQDLSEASFSCLLSTSPCFPSLCPYQALFQRAGALLSQSFPCIPGPGNPHKPCRSGLLGLPLEPLLLRPDATHRSPSQAQAALGADSPAHSPYGNLLRIRFAHAMGVEPPFLLIFGIELNSLV